MDQTSSRPAELCENLLPVRTMDLYQCNAVSLLANQCILLLQWECEGTVVVSGEGKEVRPNVAWWWFEEWAGSGAAQGRTISNGLELAEILRIQ